MVRQVCMCVFSVGLEPRWWVIPLDKDGFLCVKLKWQSQRCFFSLQRLKFFAEPDAHRHVLTWLQETAWFTNSLSIIIGVHILIDSLLCLSCRGPWCDGGQGGVWDREQQHLPRVSSSLSTSYRFLARPTQWSQGRRKITSKWPVNEDYVNPLTNISLKGETHETSGRDEGCSEERNRGQSSC